jgi:hypothetical protein
MSDRKAVWAVSDRGEGKKSWWTRVGSAFVNKDGSWTIMLDALPTNGKLVVREEEQRDRPQQKSFGGSDDDAPF